jgi:hypothetical protein
VPSLGELRREFAVEDAADPSRKAGLSLAQVALLVIGVLVFGGLLVVGCVVSFAEGGLAGVGYLIGLLGQIWLLVLMVRECHPDAIVLALLIPFFTWYFAWQRWDIAKWALACNLGGIWLCVFAVYGGF